MKSESFLFTYMECFCAEGVLSIVRGRLTVRVADVDGSPTSTPIKEKKKRREGEGREGERGRGGDGEMGRGERGRGTIKDMPQVVELPPAFLFRMPSTKNKYKKEKEYMNNKIKYKENINR